MSKVNVKWDSNNRMIFSFEGIVNPFAYIEHVAKFLNSSRDESIAYIGEKMLVSIKDNKNEN